MYSEDLSTTGKPQALPLGNDRFTQSQLDYFRLRTEAYISIWEEATLIELINCNLSDYRSLYSMRNALQRVYWGNHLREDQLYRLIQADLRIYTDPDYSNIDSQYRDIIEELLDQHDLIFLYRENNQEHYTDRVEENPNIDYKFYQWQCVLNNLGDNWENEEKTKDSLISRWQLDLLYKSGRLSSEQTTKLIELDKKVMLSPNSIYMNSFERRFIYSFLMSQGVFDRMPKE
jgi:hypothetical protein